CLICTAPSQYALFGVNSCRSCADFYKRTIAADRKFTCRQGDGKCTISPKNRHNCRGCRFERCKTVGMSLSVNKPRENELPDLSMSLPPEQNSLVARVCSEYKSSVARRKMCEFTLLPTALRRHVKVNLPNDEFLLCSWTFLVEVLKLYSGDYLRYASACFPAFEALKLEDQRLMLKNFAVRLFNAEVHSNTYKLFGSLRGPLYMATLMTMYDSRNHKFFTEEESPESSKDTSKIMEDSLERQIALVEPILARAHFTDTEYAVLFALLIWQIDVGYDLPSQIVDLFNAERRNLFEALKRYYAEDLKLDDYATRLGNLISYEQAIQVC
ncbi:hypothetical protein PENTCL1PPCAC_5323, partial [Pristionchus entomophagus]